MPRDDEVIPPATARALAAIRCGIEANDAAFDALFPPAMQSVSRRFWTPIAVALVAARMLVDRRSARVLDIGAGVGKLCLVGALSTGASFTGLERRPGLVDIARGVAGKLQLSTASFVHGELEAIDWGQYDSIYLFNPFEENLFGPEEQLDQSVPLSDARFHRDVSLVEHGLKAAPVGMRLVTYHGFGGRVPPGYRLMEEFGPGVNRLCLWVKVSERTRLESDEKHASTRVSADDGAP